MIVATKGAHYSFEDPSRSRVNRKDICADLDESCRTLGTDVIDFYWLHRDDQEKLVEEIVDIHEDLQKEGRTGILVFQLQDRTTERDPEMPERKKSSGNHGSFQPVEPCRNQSGRKYQPRSYTCGVFQEGI